MQNLTVTACITAALMGTSVAGVAMTRDVQADTAVQIACTGKSIGDAAKDAACTAMLDALNRTGRAAIAGSLDASRDTNGLYGEVQIVRASTEFVEARLSWVDCAKTPCTEPVSGPLIEVSVSDAVVGPITYQELAETLLTLSPPPRG